jgi:hypothetical protein
MHRSEMMPVQMQTLEIVGHDTIPYDDLKLLAGASGSCISIVANIPNPAVLPIRMKAALRSVEKQLKDRGMGAAATEPLIQPVRDLAAAAEAAHIWSNALIIFRSPDVFRYYLLYRRAPEIESVDEHFQVRPLLAAMTREQEFYVLGLNRRQIRLLYCTQHRAEERHGDSDMPLDIAVWLNTRQPDHVLSNRSTAGPSVGAMKGVRFGTSTDSDREDEYLAHFYKAVDRSVTMLLRGERAGLLLAGTESEVALYRRLAGYPNIFDEHIHGSTDNLPDSDLHRRALELVMQSRSEALEKALADFASRREDRRVSLDITDAIRAAFEGRAEYLFVAERAEMRGAWNAETHQVETTIPDEDLLNSAALQAIQHGGRAFVLDVSDMPDAREVAAVLRY